MNESIAGPQVTNLLTQSEAEQRQCRQAFVVRQVSTMSNGMLAWAFPNCAGAGCAHWRWHPHEVTTEPHDGKPRGCCGLAGGAPWI